MSDSLKNKIGFSSANQLHVLVHGQPSFTCMDSAAFPGLNRVPLASV